MAVTSRPHEEPSADPIVATGQWTGLVHTPIPVGKALKIPLAKKAMDKEWDGLMQSPGEAWDLKSVRPRREVIA